MELKKELLEFLRANNNFGLIEGLVEGIVDTYISAYKQDDKPLNEKKKSPQSSVDKLIAKYNHTWNINGRLSSGISYSQIIDELEKLKEEMNQEHSQEKENKSLEEFINSQPYYGHCTPEYLEGIEVGAKWQEEQSKKIEKEQSIHFITHHLNELAVRYSEGKSTSEVFKQAHEEDFKAGFQKAIEILNQLNQNI